MIRKQKDWGLIFITSLLIIIPMILAIVTSYTLYLKYKIRNLEVKINELKEVTQFDNEVNQDFKEKIYVDFKEIEKFLNIKPKGIIEREKIDLFYLIKKSKSSFQNNEIGGVTLLNGKDVFFQSINSLEHEKEYFLTKIATDLYSFYSETLNSDVQKVFTVQLRLYLTEENAFFTALTLRNAGLPVFVYKDRFQNSGKSYFAICSGLFADINEAKKYSEKIDEDRILQLTGLSVKDRFLKSFNLIGNKKNEEK
ncbi:hypothetical protein SAMN02745164_01854 [Marinitoga hydrogenitolerans DSM 16785]|uniref:SPOR domain-containing protein n=1 Tax=Marinitoga hydrogenitolerans (strain DSM 16785 / JCM 12826 / AT1271) TaxID=1122195 RepID=A0A1M4Z619_MARH1|nr:hypothetical protein [Marinitoga hydrogenitolerans]SHF13513.1 hypothetical protein SAMN02745164_01854 [Marinitoga hydrogenitolerans DSM 16785]